MSVRLTSRTLVLRSQTRTVLSSDAVIKEWDVGWTASPHNSPSLWPCVNTWGQGTPSHITHRSGLTPSHITPHYCLVENPKNTLTKKATTLCSLAPGSVHVSEWLCTVLGTRNSLRARHTHTHTHTIQVNNTQRCVQGPFPCNVEFSY